VFKDLDKTGKLKIIGMATQARHPELPDIPTIGETVPGIGVDVWFSFSAPAHTPEPILDKLHADMAGILQDRAFVDGFVRPQGFTVHPMSRQAFVAQVRADYALWGRMAEAAGLKRN